MFVGIKSVESRPINLEILKEDDINEIITLEKDDSIWFDQKEVVEEKLNNESLKSFVERNYNRAKDAYRDLPFCIEVSLEYDKCPNCRTTFSRHIIGRNHTHATCLNCEQRFETGLVLYKVN